MENRQTQILIYLFENKDQYVTGFFLADLVHASLRTVKNEIRELSEKASDFGAMVESIPSKGYHLTILDSTRFQQKITTLSENYNTLLNMNDPLFRVHFMLAKMLQSTDFIPASRFMEEMYVSRSTVSNDLIHLKALLSAYDLSLESRPNRGLRIVGKEKDKRRCIINENVPNSLVNNTTDDNLVDQITDSILSILIDAHYKVSDIIFQNLVLHIELSVKRRSQGFVIENVTVPKTPEFLHVRQIAEKITRKMCEEYNLEYSEQEANYLAIALQGKRELDNPSYINKEINDFVFDSLKEIKNTYHIDLLQDTRLRIALALHTLPLLTRAREHSQINNVLKLSIKQNFPFAYDLATSFAYQLQKRYHVHLIDDEISYLAVHFSVSLENTPDKTEKKILLISAQKPSDTILIQQKIYQWFQNPISLFDTISLMKLDSIEFEKYDTIFTTEPDLASRYRTMVLIPYFLTNLDYPKIELAINGFSSADSILDKFSPDLFFVIDHKEKDEILRSLCLASEAKHHCAPSLLSSVMLHEQIGNTYFGNMVAMPHPEKLVSDSTFIATAVLKEPILWTDQDAVQLVFLVSIEKNNPKAYQLWFYLSYLISNNDALDRIIQNPTFENLKNVIRSIYATL